MNKDDFKLFINFLKLSHSYNKYKNNFYKDAKWRHTYKFPVKSREFFIYRRKFRFISSAFEWGKTKEGFAFWSMVNSKWKVICCNG